MANGPKITEKSGSQPVVGVDMPRVDFEFQANEVTRLAPSVSPVPTTFAEQVAFDLDSSRPVPRAGTPSKEVRDLRRVLFEKFAELDSRREPALAGYAKNMCSILALLGYRGPMLDKVPELGHAIAAHIKEEFAALKGLGIRPAAIRRRGHLMTYAQFEDLVTRAPKLFDVRGERSKSRFMIDLVVRGLYPNVDALHLKHEALTAEARRLFADDKETAPVAGSAVALVLRTHRESLAECLAIYKKALREGREIAQYNRDFEPLIRTMAGFVMAGRYDSMHEAERVYAKRYREVKEQFQGSPEMESLVRSTAVLLIKGAYKGAQQAFDVWRSIHTDMQSEITRNPELGHVARSIELLVYSKNYKNVSQAVSRYEKALTQANALFEVDENGRTFARTAAHLVLQRRHKSVYAVHRTQQKLLHEAMKLCGESEDGAEVAKTLVITVLKNTHPSIASAREAYQSALDDCTEKFRRFPTVARTAALFVLLKRFDDAGAALRRYGECLHEAKLGLCGDECTEPLIKVFGDMLFRESISSIAEARPRYLRILAQCGQQFGAHEDTRGIIRTAALLVFRGVYPGVSIALSVYQDYLEGARAEYRYAKDEAGKDVPGIRALAMKRFERRGNV